MFVLLVCYLWLTPLLSLFAQPYSAHDVERIGQLGLCLAGAVLAVQSSHGKQGCATHFSKYHLCLTAIGLGLSLAAIGHAAVPYWAGVEFCLMIGLGVTALTIGKADISTREFCMGVLIGVGPYYVLQFGILIGALAVHAPILRSEFFAGYSNYRFFSHVQTVALPLLAVLCCTQAVSGRMRVLARILLVLGFSLTIYSAGRGTAVGLIGGAIFVAMLVRHSGWTSMMAMTAVGGASVYLVVFELLPRWLGVPTEANALDAMQNIRSIELRYYLWDLATEYIRESPLLGIGPMHFAHRVNTEAAHPHNSVLQIAAEWGLPMLLLALMVTARAYKRIWTVLSHESDQERLLTGSGLIASAVGVAIDSLFSGNLVMPLPQMWIVFLLAWAVSWSAKEPLGTTRSDSISIPSAARIAVAAMLLGTQLWMVWAIHDQAMNLDDYVKQVQERVRNDHDSPRFWSDGWI